MMSSLRGRGSSAAAAAATSAPLSPDRSNGCSNKQSGAAAATPKLFRHRRRTICNHIRLWWSASSSRRKTALVIAVTICFPFTVISIIDSIFGKYGLPNHDATDNHVIHESSFSVVINTYKRPLMLQQAIQHYAVQCGRRSGVSDVFVVWAEQDNPPPNDPYALLRKPHSLKGTNHTTIIEDNNQSQIHFIQVPNSLNSRFLPIPAMKTTGLFMVDDDVQVDCASLAQGFEAWKVFPNSMVGYYPRLASLARRGSGVATYIEHCWPIVFLRQRVNFVLTKASFLHRRYLDVYSSNQHLADIKEYVDEQMNCEDIAMSLLVANVTKYESSQSNNKQQLPSKPIYVQGSIYDQGLFGGISTKSGFVGRRAKCLSDLVNIYARAYGNNELLETTFALREVSWRQHAPGYWWQHRPSNPFEWGALLDFFQ
ncbi:hypothetical protein MPSEU_000320900 [Mayamaea pseudoterrestris]|nr:hypothetical protein MPSEU_000320900 [Mayamaea pseudoterrestris]